MPQQHVQSYRPTVIPGLFHFLLFLCATTSYVEVRLFVSVVRPIDPHRTGCKLTAGAGWGLRQGGEGGGGHQGPSDLHL